MATAAVGLVAAQTSTAATAKASPVKVLIYGDITPVPGVSSFSPLLGQAKAAIDTANAAGGINGHPIQLVVCDTKVQPSVAIACSESAVKQHVVAAISSESVLEPQVLSPLEKAGIPLIGDLLNTPQGTNYKEAYCINNGAAGLFEGTDALAKSLGAKKVGFITPGGTPSTAAFDSVFATDAKEYGLQSNDSNPAVSETNWTSAAEAAGSGAQSIFLVSPGSAVAFSEQIKAALPNIKLIVASVAATFGKFPDSLNGTYAIGWNQPPTATSVPGIKRYLTSVNKYDPGADKTDIGVVIWSGADLFARAARTIHGSITAKSMIAAMNALKDFPMYGVTPNYTASKRGEFPGSYCSSNATVVPMTFKGGLLYANHPGQFTSVKTK